MRRAIVTDRKGEAIHNTTSTSRKRSGSYDGNDGDDDDYYGGCVVLCCVRNETKIERNAKKCLGTHLVAVLIAFHYHKDNGQQ